MKKNGKFVFGLLSAAAVAGGAYYFVKNFLNKDSEDDFDDFDDDFEDVDFDDDDNTDVPSEGREYVTLNMTSPVEETVSTEDTCVCESETEDTVITEEAADVVTEDAPAETVTEEKTIEETETTEE